MSGIGLFYALMTAVLGFFVGYFWLVARALAKQVQILTDQLRATYKLEEFLDEIKESESEKIEDSEV
jgi:predicted PurR-regulated permease PerM